MNLSAADESRKYLIDTDVLVHIHRRRDSEKLVRGVIALVDAGKLRTVSQVFGELKNHETPYNTFYPHKRALVISRKEQFVRGIRDKIEYLGNYADYLWEQTGSKNPDPADPWLVAVASEYGYTVVTDEKHRSSQRIPAACKLVETQCRCIHGPHFLMEVGIVKEVDPAHISPTDFYG